jgi:hypothetical protein
MAKLLMVALTNAADGREDEFHDWYENTHVPQIRAVVPGVGEVHRYRAADVQATPEPPAHQFLAVYEIEADNPGAVLGALGAGIQSGAVAFTGVLDTTKNPPVTVVYEAL